MDWEFFAHLLGWFTVALAAIVAAAKFSPGGTAALKTFKFWALPLGAALPGCVLLAWVLVSAEASDHPAMAAVLVAAYVAMMFWLGCFVSLFLSRPAGNGWRLLIGVLGNLLGTLSLAL